jgi:serpin B
MRHLAFLAMALLLIGSFGVLSAIFASDGLFAADPPAKEGAVKEGAAKEGAAPSPNEGAAVTETPYSVEPGEADFASDIFKELSKGKGNIFFSPASVTEVLAMAYAGAAGSTAKAFEKTLRHSGDVNRLLSRYGHLALRLAVDKEKEDLELMLNNSLWVSDEGGEDPEFEINPDFAEQLYFYFDSGVYPVDFKNDGETARGLINDWASENTKGKIKDLFSMPLDPKTKLVLVNAVYFNGEWTDPFDPLLTQEKDFHLEDGSVAKAPFMRREGKYDYMASKDGVSVIRLPYGSGNLSLFILLPDDSQKSLEELQNKLSSELLESYLNDLKETKVDVYIPKFSFTWGTESLKDILIKLGLSEAFSPKADFSGISSKGGLYISDLIHKAFVEVDEKGTTAAAATGAVGRTTSIAINPTPVFLADHPFLFLIMEKSSGVVIFLGRLSDPSSAG